MERDTEPYLVFTRNRPHRLVFIVDITKKAAFDTIVRLINASSTKWGGAYYQIIPAQGKTVADHWIQYISEYDPDLIYTFDKLSATTVKRITYSCNPYTFMYDNRSNDVPSHPHDPIDALPDNLNTARLWRNPFNKPEILSFDIGEFSIEAPKYIADFIQVNFGTLSNDTANSRAIAASGASIKEAPARSRSQFLESMKLLSEWNRRIYPIEYCMLPGLVYESPTMRSNDVPTLFIGDTPQDLIFYWNDALQRPDWLSHQRNQAWVSEKFLKDKQLQKVLHSWVHKLARQRQNTSDVRELHIASSSIPLGTLQKYARLLAKGHSVICTTEKIAKPKELKYGKNIATSIDMESFSVSGDSFTINVPQVGVGQGARGGQRWMTDVFIERKDHNEYRQPLKDFWLQLPSDNNLASLITGYQMAARINRDGILSIPLNRDKDILRLSLRIPEDAKIAESILLGERNSIHYTGDLRKGIEKRPFYAVGSSLAGRSLRGAIHLFGGLAGAAQFFEGHFWRDTFMTLAGSNPLGDTAQATALKNKIEKNLKKVSQPLQPKAVDAWVKTVTDYASNLRAMSEIKPYSFFADRLKQEIAEAKKRGDTDKFETVERRLLSRLDWLIERGILSGGIMNRCPHCGLKAWHSIDELKTNNDCRGCGYGFAVRAEQKWWYKLNSLISSDGGIYNQIPLILALGELYEQSTSSFYYYPPVDVYGRATKSPLTDLDIFAIVDGELVIGEVKNTQKLFSDDDFEKIQKAALRLRPSRVVLAAINEKPSTAIVSKIKAMDKKLNPKGIKVEWLETNPMYGIHGLWSI
ncbi:MAG TPA: hypothetical protein VMR45_01435 [Patescibacteria group bacterium]|nr:hypothetical protein [Patescibacteria group bacterium]